MNKTDKVSIPNGFLALIVLVIFISGIATMLVSGHKLSTGTVANSNDKTKPSQGTSSGDSLSGLNSKAAAPNAYEDKSNLPEGYRLITVLNDDIHKGPLILVNYLHPSYIDGENLVNIYDNASSSIGVKDNDMFINESIVEPINSFFDEFRKQKGDTSILISSSYRSKEAQTKIYNDSVKDTGARSTAYYVSVPGYSEHQTGYAFDTATYNNEGDMVELDGEGAFEWLSENCKKYGFILRYPSTKTNITGIGYEAWHFRYVGIPHAIFISEHDICFEEYIEGIKSYTFDKGGLLIDGGKDGKWVVFYIPKLEAFNNTDIPVPTDTAKTPYTISGNNIDGFIVTVDVTKDVQNILTKTARTDWNFDNATLIIENFQDYDPESDDTPTMSSKTNAGDNNGGWEDDPFWDEDNSDNDNQTASESEDYGSRFDYVDYYDEYDEDYDD